MKLYTKEAKLHGIQGYIPKDYKFSKQYCCELHFLYIMLCLKTEFSSNDIFFITIIIIVIIIKMLKSVFRPCVWIILGVEFN